MPQRRPKSASSRIAAFRALRVAAIAILVAMVGCEPGPSENLDADPMVLLASDVRVFGGSDSIAAVTDLEVLADGSVWILNSVEPLFLGFDVTGEVVRAHGRRGGGPDEFEAPAGFVVGGIDGAAWILDLQRHSLIQVSDPDAARREISLPPDAIPPGSLMGGMHPLSNVVRTGRLGDEVVVARSRREEGIFGFWHAGWSADLVALPRGSGGVREVVALGQALGDPRGHFDLSDGFLPFPLWYRLWAVCSDSEIRVYDRIRNTVRGFRPDGDELAETALPAPRHPRVTPRQFARVTIDVAIVEGLGEVGPGDLGVSSTDSARILAAVLPRLQLPPEKLADLLPRYVDYRCAEDGTQWIQPLDIDRGGLRGGPVWLRITADGEIREVHLPDRFEAYRFRPGRVWGVLRDEFDVASVAWIPVER